MAAYQPSDPLASVSVAWGVYSSLDGMLVHRRVTPNIKIAATQLCSRWSEALWQLCLESATTEEDNTLSLARTRTRTARCTAADERTAPPPLCLDVWPHQNYISRLRPSRLRFMFCTFFRWYATRLTRNNALFSVCPPRSCRQKRVGRRGLCSQSCRLWFGERHLQRWALCKDNIGKNDNLPGVRQEFM